MNGLFKTIDYKIWLDENKIIGLVGTIYNQIGFKVNKIIGLVETEILKIGYEKNKDVGLVETINYQTPTDNPQSTSQRTQKVNRAHVDNMKQSTRTQRKNKRGNTPQPRIDSTRINSD